MRCKRNLDASAALSKLTPAQTQLPDWTILTPASGRDDARRIYAEAEQASGIPWAYLAAIHFLETRMGRIHGNSTAGAQGPMQFIPSTWAAYGNGGDVNDNRDAILAAGRYLKAAGGPADMDKAIFAYNHDRRVRARGQGLRREHARRTRGRTTATTSGRCTTAPSTAPCYSPRAIPRAVRSVPDTLPPA